MKNKGLEAVARKLQKRLEIEETPTGLVIVLMVCDPKTSDMNLSLNKPTSTPVGFVGRMLANAVALATREEVASSKKSTRRRA